MRHSSDLPPFHVAHTSVSLPFPSPPPASPPRQGPCLTSCVSPHRKSGTVPWNGLGDRCIFVEPDGGEWGRGSQAAKIIIFPSAPLLLLLLAKVLRPRRGSRSRCFFSGQKGGSPDGHLGPWFLHDDFRRSAARGGGGKGHRLVSTAGGTLITEMLTRLFGCVLFGRTGEFLSGSKRANQPSQSHGESLSREHKAEATAL